MPQQADSINALKLTPTLPAPQGMLNCTNTQCRVEVFRPHRKGPAPTKCPACYGVGS